MFEKKKNLVLILSMSIILICNSSNVRPQNSRIISNQNPEYNDDSDFVTLKKLNSIDTFSKVMSKNDYSIKDVSVIRFDAEDNMYILDKYASKIIVFDNEGNYLRALGGQGWGPKEFDGTRSFFIKDRQLYVLQRNRYCKILDLSGNYISEKLVPPANLSWIEPYDNKFLLHIGVPDRELKLKYRLSIAGNDFNDEEIIFEYDFPPGLTGPNFRHDPRKWLEPSENGEFYFAEDNYNSYLIGKYDIKGSPIIKFRRPYKIKHYSQKSKENFKIIYKRAIEEGRIKMPESPPVIRTIIRDDHKYLWVVSGETSYDNDDPEYENTVDIFDENGKWKYSFKSKYVSQKSIIHKNRLYDVTLIDPESGKQFINVYQIEYGHNKRE